MDYPLKGIIIDDEPFARYDLRRLLGKHPCIEIVNEASDIEAAVALLSGTPADVIFLDIELRGGSGFDLVPHIPSRTEIVFFTAHDEYAIRAFEVNALDYLLKPVAEDRLANTIARLKGRIHQEAPTAVPLKPFRSGDRIFVKTDEGRFFVSLNTITAITSLGGNYTVIHLDTGKRHVVGRTLKAWDIALPAPPFLQIHRAAVVNIERIERIDKEINGAYIIFPAGCTGPLTVSRRAAPLLKERIREIL